ncbi:hypothetical protein PSEUDO9AG_41241 [Pseudomonas sp. 9Ag]|nr:hypothetical protein PSEUDO9AG_41241 [Pseudomonas sp. 9Ag]
MPRKAPLPQLLAASSASPHVRSDASRSTNRKRDATDHSPRTAYHESSLMQMRKRMLLRGFMNHFSSSAPHLRSAPLDLRP